MIGVRTEGKALVALELLQKAVEFPHLRHRSLRPTFLLDNLLDFLTYRLNALGVLGKA